MLSAADLAYMRETQAETRPTAAELLRRTQTTSPSGGRTDTLADPEPIQVRLDGQESNVPTRIAELASGKPVKITMDLVEVRAGDLIRVGQAEYQVITTGDPDEWATAQVVWGQQTKEPPRG